MPSALELTPEMYDHVARLYREGLSMATIGEKIGVSHPVIRRMLQKSGVRIRTDRRSLIPEQEEAVVSMRKQGWNIDAIAEYFGCSAAPITRILREAGLPHTRRESKQLTPEVHHEVISIYQSSPSVTCHGLGKRFGTHGNEIRRILQLHGVPIRDGRNRRGPDNPIFRNGRWTGPDGYVRVYVSDDDPFSTKTKRRHVLEHRLVMARHLGRPLTDTERVHHKNGAKDDNRIENLELWTYAHPPGQRVSDKPPHCPTCTCCA